MTIKSDLNTEASIVDLSNEDLRDMLLYLHTAIKNLNEAKKADPELEQMKAAMKAYADDNYNSEIKEHTAKLKAGHAQAKLRGLRIKMPEDV